ncbi:hypothetical protein CFP56_023190 [Quercus suber]|uniref:Uncharacterized protein n=1 Tax=Quercus suber TaxID=58331 RepID=A0AAW0M0T2_QUESU
MTQLTMVMQNACSVYYGHIEYEYYVSEAKRCNRRKRFLSFAMGSVEKERGDETDKGDVYTEKEAEKERGDESKKFHKTILPPSKRQAILFDRHRFFLHHFFP